MKKHILFFIALFFALYISAQYTVGVKTISYTDAARSNRAVGVEFHYPGTNAAVAAGQFPFVIFAHGFSMDQTPYTPYADTLAKRGYIVGLLTTETGFSPSHANFAQDLIFMYGKLIAEGSNNAAFFYQHVIAKGALGGHSMGGGSTVLSAQYGNPQVCSFTFAAATTNPSSISIAHLMTKPYLSFAGSSDCIAPVATNQQPMYDSSGAPCKFLITIANGLHCQYGNANSACSLGEGFSGCASSSLTRQQQIDKTLYHLVPFLDYYLKGDCSAWTLFETRYTANVTDAKQRNCTNTVPSNPSITGTLSFCSGSNTTLTANPSGFNYLWNDNSIAGTLGVNAAGNYSVVVGNGTCALAAVSASVTVNLPPSTPAAITGGDTVCANSANISISVTNNPLATTYNWTLPNGWNITNGNNTNAIQATAGATGGTISVTAQNNCGTTSPSTKQTTVAVAPTISAITASDTVCTGIANIVISVANDPNTTYSWTLPSGWNITAGNNTNSIQATSGNTGGTISVIAQNNCGTTQPVTKTMVVVPSNLGTPGSISGAANICSGTSQQYSIVVVSGAASYIWTFPSGWSATSATNTTSISLTTGNTSGNISVQAVNSCGNSAPADIAVTVNTAPVLGILYGLDTVCLNSTGALNFSLSSATGADSIVWSVTNPWNILGGQGSSVLSVNSYNTNGSVYVYGSNFCGSTLPLTFQVVYVDTPQITITQQAAVLHATVTGATNYQWYNGGALIAGATGVDYTPTANGDYTVSVTNQYGCSTQSASFSFVYNSVNEILTEETFNVFPNPNTTGALQITTGSNLIGAKLKVFDVTGKLVFQSSIFNLQSSISTTQFSKGVYVISIEAKQISLRKKMIIE